jgi:hypothetical protein
MAWIWNRILPKAMRAETTPSARIDGYVASKIQPDGRGLALAVVKAGPSSTRQAMDWPTGAGALLHRT